MKKKRIVPTISFLAFLFLLFFLLVSVAPVFSQTTEAPKTRFKKYPFTLSWKALDYAGWYILEIQNAKGKLVARVKTKEAYYVFNAYPGQYNLKIYVYNKLGALEAESAWRPFTVVLPKREVEKEEEEKEKIAPRNYLILANIEVMSSLGELALDQNYSWAFSSMITLAPIDIAKTNWATGVHLYFSGNTGQEDSFLDFVGSITSTGFVGYHLNANKTFSCIPFAEIGMSFPFLVENKDQGLDNKYISVGFMGGIGSTFMMHFDKFFLSATFAYSLNVFFIEGEGVNAAYFKYTFIEPTAESGFHFTLGCGVIF